MSEPKMWWPDVFTNSDFEYSADDPRLVANACGDGHVGWGNCMSGCAPPENFGAGMVKVGLATGTSASPDSLMELSNRLLKKPSRLTRFRQGFARAFALQESLV